MQRVLPLTLLFSCSAMLGCETAGRPSNAPEVIVVVQPPVVWPGSAPAASAALPEPAGPTASEDGDEPDVPLPPEPRATAAPAGPIAPVSSAAAGPPLTAPQWRFTGSGSKPGEMFLRCEGARGGPRDAPGGCTCGASLLNPCTEEREHEHGYVDRTMCAFTCAPRHASTFELRCPDGGTPGAAASGCACGAQVLHPCGRGGVKSVTIRGDVCAVTCS